MVWQKLPARWQRRSSAAERLYGDRRQIAEGWAPSRPQRRTFGNYAQISGRGGVGGIATAGGCGLARSGDDQTRSGRRCIGAKACAGDVQAIKAVFERIDGKVSAEQSAAPPRDLIIVHTFKSKI